MTKKRYRFGLVGCGAAGKNHLSQMLAVPEIEVPAVADLRRDVAVQTANLHGIPNVYDNYSEMFAKEQLDAVAVITSADAHYPVAKSALQHGLHVFCEKPLTVEPKESYALVTLAKKMNKLLAVTFTYHFVPETRRIKEIIESGRLGQLLEIRFFCLNGNIDFYPAGSDEKRKYDHIYQKVKGMIFDCGVHAFELLCWLGNSRVKRIDARATCHLGYHFPETCTAILELENGIKAVYDYGKFPYYDPAMPCRTWFHILATGTKGSLVYDFGGTHKDHRQSMLNVYTAKAKRQIPFPIYAKERTLQYRQFIVSLKKGRLTGYFPSPEQSAYATEVADQVVKLGIKNLIPSPLPGIQK